MLTEGVDPQDDRVGLLAWRVGDKSAPWDHEEPENTADSAVIDARADEAMVPFRFEEYA